EALEKTNEVAHAVLVLCVVSIAGFAIAAVKIRGIGLGGAGVLFAGLFFGHFGWKIEHNVLDFAREFGLILFVFTIGLQIGPGFFASLQRQGLALNLCAAAIVLGGAGLAALTVPLLGAKPFAAAGLFSGSTTNTPSLGAGQEAISAVPNATAEDKAMPALAYAVTYPGGVFGIIASVILLGKLFRVRGEAELEAFENERRSQIVPLHRRNLELTNPNLDGVRVGQIPGLHQGVVVSRLKSLGSKEIRLATDDATVQVGDILLAVGTEEALEKFQRIVGRVSQIDLMETPGRVEFRHLLVTRKEVLGKSLRQLALETLCGVVVTRIQRGGVEITARADFRVEFGDSLHVVGDAEGLDEAAALVGDSRKELVHTNFLPVFAGIALGVIFGLIPIAMPGLPVPVRLGLAGGPLVAAIVLSWLGRIGSVVWYMPSGANLALRELGIVLFLACVGLKAGSRFMDTLLSQDGPIWLLAGLCITVVPLLAVGIFARIVLKMNFVVLSGLMAGSMTDPPALAFANTLIKSDAPSVSYAAVYPLTMLLRILCAQFIVLLLV
ncbi:MAG TPA: putative transporter, partial [Terrimicrobiaceae bacterium]|nr:putative transporter [Terrimicrobiaceae bacterium]